MTQLRCCRKIPSRALVRLLRQATRLHFIALLFLNACFLSVCYFFVPSHEYRRLVIKREPFVLQLNYTAIRLKRERWHALERLNGSAFRANYRRHCGAVKLIQPRKHGVQPPRGYKFKTSELFGYPSQVDVLEKICRFEQGASVVRGSYKNRNFKLLINPENLCHIPDAEGSLFLLLLIKSAADNFAARNLIRQSWADIRCWSGKTIRHAFLLGITTEDPLLKLIREESLRYEDIIQQEFLDSYHNNTHKVLLGLKWAIAFCPEAKWIVFADDDFLINPKRVISFTQALNSNLQSHIIGGNSAWHAMPFRDLKKNPRWAVSSVIYPYHTYPTYVHAGTFFVNAQMAIKLYIASRFTLYFPFDDVFIGLLMNKIVPAKVQIRYDDGRTRPVHSSAVQSALAASNSQQILQVHFQFSPRKALRL
ncbi:unnamed protein product [Calicophoron daubneyi]|uniref:Hexosyltransferase n=1 Tax=Calicophoron daubneyi TaxID=300641 RepID=A0AAV2T789_CALDB